MRKYIRRVKCAKVKPCPVCKKPFKVRRHGKKGDQKFCSRQCDHATRSERTPSMEKSNLWKGGRSIKEGGYVLITVPDRPKMVFEHRYKIEKLLGRRLHRWEFVHHRNGNKQDNRLRNLMVVTHNNHMEEVSCPKCGHHFGVH